MKAYDITFDITPQELTRTWSYDPQNKTLVADQAAVTEAGWLGSRGPGISDEQWPRSPHTGLPMQHIFTRTYRNHTAGAAPNTWRYLSSRETRGKSSKKHPHYC